MQQRNPRALAYEVLKKVLFEGAYADIALGAYLSCSALEMVDRSLATELVYGVLRNLTWLEWNLGGVLKKPFQKLQEDAQVILMLGAYQILKLSRIPAYAVVNSSVELAKAARRVSPELVNAVLRRIARQGARDLPDWSDSVLRICVEHSHPRWLVEYLISQFGVAGAESACRANNEPPPLDLRVNTLKTTISDAMDSLAADGVRNERCPYAAEGLRVISQKRPLGQTKAHQSGHVYVMDEAAMLVAPASGVVPGQTALDACSAPGGKALHLAALMENQGKVLALDTRRARLELVRENASRLGASNIETQLLDARKAGTEYEGVFDVVLVDAPCTGLGVLRRRPDLRWRKDAGDAARLHELQSQILNGVAPAVKPGGVLLYSTCSIHPAENDVSIEQFLGSHPDFFRDTLLPYVPDALHPWVTQGTLQLYTHVHGTDGFYIARLVRARRA